MLTFNDLMETACSWHSGQNSALYSLLSTEIVHSITHKCDLAHELIDEIQGDGMDEPCMMDEKKQLIALALMVATAPIGESLSECVVDHTGRLISMVPLPVCAACGSNERAINNEQCCGSCGSSKPLVPHGWDTITV